MWITLYVIHISVRYMGIFVLLVVYRIRYLFRKHTHNFVESEPLECFQILLYTYLRHNLKAHKVTL
jgi:hypothetical protein